MHPRPRPEDGPLPHVVKVARVIHELAEEIGLPDYVKTSGSTGLHVLVPLGGLCTFHQCTKLGELLARVVAGRLPDIATTIRLRTTAAAASTSTTCRTATGSSSPLPSPPAPSPAPSAPPPLLWDEVDETLELSRFTIKTLPERMPVLGRDPSPRSPRRSRTSSPPSRGCQRG